MDERGARNEFQLHGRMPARPESTTNASGQAAAKPGTTLVTVGLSIALIAVLAVAVADQREQRSVAEATAVTTPKRAQDSNTSVSVNPVHSPSPGPALGHLEAWPPVPTMELPPPAYEPPYPSAETVEPGPSATFRLPPPSAEDANLPTDLSAGEGPSIFAAPEDNAREELEDPTYEPHAFDNPHYEPLEESVDDNALDGPELAIVPDVDDLPLPEVESRVGTKPQLFAAPESPVITDATVSLPAAPEVESPDTQATDTEPTAESTPDIRITDTLTNDVATRLALEASPQELMIDSPPPGEVAALLAPDVQQAFTLGQHGALFAARTRFIEVLRKVANARDGQHSTDEHSVALAAGLRALEEAVQFVPRGDAIEADMDVAAIAASHSTTLLKDDENNVRWTPPNEAIARYHRYAQHKLAAAVAGNQAASMALHGLGKTYHRLATLDEAPLAQRTSLTMFRAAIEAHPGNYLAANELGVGLAKVGQYQAACASLERAIVAGGTSTVYRNMAAVQQKLGQPQLAAAALGRAERLAAVERARGAFSKQQGIQWVDRQRLARVGDAYGNRTTAAPQAASRPANQPPSLASRLMPWRRSNQAATPVARPLPSQPAPMTNRVAPPVRSQTIVR